MDMDVRRAVRTIEYVGFNGLSIEELTRFRDQADVAIIVQKYGLKIGDKVKSYGGGREGDKNEYYYNLPIDYRWWHQGYIIKIHPRRDERPPNDPFEVRLTEHIEIIDSKKIVKKMNNWTKYYNWSEITKIEEEKNE